MAKVFEFNVHMAPFIEKVLPIYLVDSNHLLHSEIHRRDHQVIDYWFNMDILSMNVNKTLNETLVFHPRVGHCRINGRISTISGLSKQL